MFHVKQSDFPLNAQQDLWDADQLPYDRKHWQDLCYPWELLNKETLAKLIKEGHARPSSQSIETERGVEHPNGIPIVVQEDFLLHENKLLRGVIRIEDASGCHKGKMRCYLDDEAVPGATWVQAGAILNFRGDMPITFGKGCFVQSTAYIEGPSAFGNHCEVRHNAYIRGTVLAGDGCVFGHASEVKGSIFHHHAKAPHFAYVGDSILGAATNLGAGTKISNLKITGSNIRIRYQKSSKGGSHVFETGLRKLGAILGDGVETGCNSVLNPGVILGRKAAVYPNYAVPAGIYAPQSWLGSEK